MDENIEPTTFDPQVDDVTRSAEREISIPPDRILSVVGNPHRRAILNSLTSASNKTLKFDTLVNHVADKIRDETARAADEHRQRIRIELHHNHLPTLEAVRIIDYEPETKQVEFVGGELEQDLLTLVEAYNANE